jgi:pyruvate dehydrogenase E2 component (dihydrolipoamide acetyltransferase)
MKASPLAKKMAADHGISLGSVQGSGPEGRIVRRDIEGLIGGPKPAALPTVEEEIAPQKAPAPSVPAGGTYEAVPLSQMRKAISRRLSQSKFTAPHFYLMVDVAMENAAAFRTQLNELAEGQGQGKVSYNDFITKACALALREHPYVNASYLEQEGEIRLH